jgi:hypothetical protein
MPRTYISPLTKQSILSDLDQGVSRKELLARYGLKNYANIYRIIQQRSNLCETPMEYSMHGHVNNWQTPDREENEPSISPQESTNPDIKGNCLEVRLEKLKLRTRIFENVFGSVKEKLQMHRTKLEELENDMEEFIDNQKQDMDQDEDEEDDSERETDEDNEEQEETDEEDNEEQQDNVLGDKSLLKSYCNYSTSLAILVNALEALDEAMTEINLEVGKLGLLIQRGSNDASEATDRKESEDDDENMNENIEGTQAIY